METWIESKNRDLQQSCDWGRKPALKEVLMRDWEYLYRLKTLDEAEALAAMLIKYGGIETARSIAEEFLAGAFIVDCIYSRPLPPPVTVAHLGNRLGLDQKSWKKFLIQMLTYEHGKPGAPKMYQFCATVAGIVGIGLKLEDPEVATALLAQYRETLPDSRQGAKEGKIALKERELAQVEAELHALMDSPG